jgi:predicted exporter
LLGQQLSLFHIAALLLVMGIGIDYALFIARTPTDDPRFAATAGSLLLCNLSTLLVFGLLATSGLPVLFAIGMTVSVGTLLSLAFSAMMVRAAREVP